MEHENITLCYNHMREKIGEGECKCNESNGPCIIVHGGAGNFSDSIIVEKMTACKKAASNGYKMLLNGESSVDAVETALWWLECDEFFNSGYGSMLNELGKVQMDASIMDGLTFKCGSVGAVSDIEHPIALAKYVMNYFPNSIFVGDGAKHLAKHANLNWISEGNMVAPIARVTFNSTEQAKYEMDIDDQSLMDLDLLTNSFGTVGCVAYDGYSVAAGTTTGGLNRKLVGRVGDTSILGCGTYATKNVGCSLTGHGESIIKLGLARVVVEDIENNNQKEEVLQKHLSYMLKKFDKTGGGITLESNGSWATYFTSEKMPYAVIVNDLITYGAKLHEERKETYSSSNATDCECRCPFIVVFMIVASDRDLLNGKLFSFNEWQRYIECRKTILAHTHFPTKLKYSLETAGINDLYIKFLEHMSSKMDKEQSDIKNSKHFLPEELINAMTKHISSMSINDSPSKTSELFPPSLTPLHSYLQLLLDHPRYDIPAIARSDFFLTKIGYMTKPDLLIELGAQCDIELEVTDTSLHFLEKYVPPFEQPKMPSIKELQQLVDVQDDSKVRSVKASESLNDYLHAKLPCRIKFDVSKQQYYNNVINTMKNFKDADVRNDCTFADILPNGKLAIPNDSDSEDENEEEDRDGTPNIKQENILLKNTFCDKYNLCLSLAEKESISKLGTTERIHIRKQKHKMARNHKGQFMKGETTLESINDSYKNNDVSTSVIKEMHINDEGHRFFRPFTEYWMYHCIFSRVKPKNFAVFERALPRTFRWLLNECALMVEMTTEDLYEEVCLIETYHAHVLKSYVSKNDHSSNIDPLPKHQLNLILSKW